MKRGTKIAIGVGAALSLGLAAVAGAQPGGYGPGWGMGGGYGMMSTDGYGIEERLAAQKSAFKINSEQEGAWQAYAKVVKAQADLNTKRAKERFEQFEAVNTATKNLYGVLTPEQRAVAARGFHGGGWR